MKWLQLVVKSHNFRPLPRYRSVALPGTGLGSQASPSGCCARSSPSASQGTGDVIHISDTHTYTHTYIHIYIYTYIYIYIWQWVKTLYPCSSHQNSWDLWMFIPLKMVLIGIDPYPYIYIYIFIYIFRDRYRDRIHMCI